VGFQIFVLAAVVVGEVEAFCVPVLDMFVAGVACIPRLWALLDPGRN
jgi:hypothetical protein